MFGLADAATGFESPLVTSGFSTGNGGAGHAFLPSPDREAMLAFYRRVGFLLSDYIVQEVAPGVVVDAAFMHCNPRHHTIAFADMPSEKKMHHFMMEVNDRVDVGCAYDRVLNAEIPLALTLGMHPNDHMFSFYVVTPSGFAIEFGAEGRFNQRRSGLASRNLRQAQYLGSPSANIILRGARRRDAKRSGADNQATIS